MRLVSRRRQRREEIRLLGTLLVAFAQANRIRPREELVSDKIHPPAAAGHYYWRQARWTTTTAPAFGPTTRTVAP